MLRNGVNMQKIAFKPEKYYFIVCTLTCAHIQFGSLRKFV